MTRKKVSRDVAADVINLISHTRRTPRTPRTTACFHTLPPSAGHAPKSWLAGCVVRRWMAVGPCGPLDLLPKHKDLEFVVMR